MRKEHVRQPKSGKHSESFHKMKISSHVLVENRKKMFSFSREMLKTGERGFWPELPELRPAAMAVNCVDSDRGKIEGGEGYLF